MKKAMVYLISALAIGMALFHLYSAGIQLLPALQQRVVHLGFAAAIIFLTTSFIRKKKQEELNMFEHIFNVLAVIFLAAITIYIFTNHIVIIASIHNPTMIDIVIGTAIIIITLEITRRTLGYALPVIALLFLGYAFIGDKLPMAFSHTGYSFTEIVTQVGISNQGIFGTALGVSSTYIVLFVIFGALLANSGAGKLFIDLSLSLVGKFRGGAAKVSVIASALSGTISGNPVSNVVTTGVLTIPLMKRQGYPAQYAGGVETMSSLGGMFAPPVMGAVSFLIADFLQLDYAVVVIAAIIPAILYFISIFMMVDLRAAKLESQGKLNRDIELVNIKEAILTRGHLLIPILILVYFLLIEKRTPTFSAFWSIISIPLVGLIRKQTRMSFRDIVKSLEEGIRLSLMVIAACASAGIVMGVIEMTGIGLRFGGILTDFANGNLFILLVLTMISSIIIGMGLPPVASYLILAIMVAPTIVDLGVSPLAAHLFIFYFGSLSLVTPPVAVAAFAASSLAQAGPNQTAFTALKIGSVAYVIPFLFVYGPQLLLEGTVVEIIYAVITAIIGVYAFSVAVEGFFKRELSLLARAFIVVGGLMMMSVGIITDIVGLALIVFTLFVELKVAGRLGKESREAV